MRHTCAIIKLPLLGLAALELLLDELFGYVLPLGLIVEILLDELLEDE